MDIKETKDPIEIKSVLCHPEIYPRISDDRSPPREEFEPPLNIQYGAGYVNGDIIGIVVYHRTEQGLKCHFQVLPEYRKSHAREFARMALDFGEAKNASIYTEIAECYPEVIRFAKDMGFKRAGYKQEGSIKDGVNYGKIVLRRKNGNS